MQESVVTGWEEALHLRARFDDEPSHSDHVTGLAKKLFHSLSSLQAQHGCGVRQGELLQIAALLHDIGWSQTPDGKGHHKESARLIREQGWSGLTAPEVAIVAQIARYHRKTLPQTRHAGYQALPALAQTQVLFLGGILRIADALDRTHQQIVQCLSARVSSFEIRLHIQAGQSCDAELAMVAEKQDMLERATNRLILCQTKSKAD